MIELSKRLPQSELLKGRKEGAFKPVVIEDKKNFFVKTVFTKTKDEEDRMNIYDPSIWKGFPLSERIWYRLCCIRTNKLLIDEFVSNPHVLKNELKFDLVDKCLMLEILKTGTLEIEPSIIHPFVRISFVNLKTLKYLQKFKFDVPSILPNEKNLLITYNVSQNNLEYSESFLDFLPPIATPPFDMREKGESFAEWNEKFFINDEASNIFKSETIIFFELLYYNFRGGNDFPDEDDKNLFKIAWGYLRPLGLSQTYLGKFKLQLYKYKYKITKEMRALRKASKTNYSTPTVLYEFNWMFKEKYQTFLEIELRLESKPTLKDMSNIYIQSKFKNSVFKLEDGLIDEETLKLNLTKKKKKLKFEDADHLGHEKRMILLKRKKGQSEDCILPDKLLYKFTTDKFGCLTQAFSPDGRYLAAACTGNLFTVIKIFNVEEGNLVYKFNGHHELIHSLTWTENSQILISGGSDNKVKLWGIPKEQTNDSENTSHLDNERNFLLTSLSHPSYVYSVLIYKFINNSNLIILSASFDGLIRIYSLEFIYNEEKEKYTFKNSEILKTISISEDEEYSKREYDNLTDSQGVKIESDKVGLLKSTVLEHHHPNAMAIDHVGRVYIGDSFGSITVWQLGLDSNKFKANKLRVIKHKELEGDNINRIIIEPSEKKRLIVHSRDNCIRLIDIREKPKIINRYFGSQCSKSNVKSAISPDGQFVISGSEDGTPHIWSLVSGISIPAEMYECSFNDNLSDVCWNPQYNIFSVSGFGKDHPILVYVHEKKEINVDPLNFKMKDGI